MTNFTCFFGLFFNGGLGATLRINVTQHRRQATKGRKNDLAEPNAAKACGGLGAAPPPSRCIDQAYFWAYSRSSLTFAASSACDIFVPAPWSLLQCDKGEG
jgi:hypothetical protein